MFSNGKKRLGFVIVEAFARNTGNWRVFLIKNNGFFSVYILPPVRFISFDPESTGQISFTI